MTACGRWAAALLVGELILLAVIFWQWHDGDRWYRKGREDALRQGVRVDRIGSDSLYTDDGPYPT